MKKMVNLKKTVLAVSVALAAWSASEVNAEYVYTFQHHDIKGFASQATGVIGDRLTNVGMGIFVKTLGQYKKVDQNIIEAVAKDAGIKLDAFSQLGPGLFNLYTSSSSDGVDERTLLEVVVLPGNPYTPDDAGFIEKTYRVAMPLSIVAIGITNPYAGLGIGAAYTNTKIIDKTYNFYWNALAEIGYMSHLARKDLENALLNENTPMDEIATKLEKLIKVEEIARRHALTHKKKYGKKVHGWR